MTPKILLTELFLFLLKVSINSQDLESPCPDLFIYTGHNNKSSEWYGTIKLLSNMDLLDVWLHLTFDTAPLRQENSFGEIVNRDRKEYFIEKPDFTLKALAPHRFSFILKYSPDGPVPELLSFELNGKLVCSKSLQLAKVKAAIVNNICGTVAVNSDKSTFDGAFPWHAAVYYLKDKQYIYLCAASLLSKNYLITAARCVVKPKSQTPLIPDTLMVMLGKRLLQKDSSTSLGVQNNISKVILHPGYNAGTNLHNIALLKLAVPVDFEDTIRPVCLWKDSVDLESVLRQEGTVGRWDVDEAGKLKTELIQTQMFVLPQEMCGNSTSNVSRNMYCAKFKEGTTICNGYDLGGGMVFKRGNVGRVAWQLRGLASVEAAPGARLQCNASQYVEFTDTAHYLDWIESSME